VLFAETPKGKGKQGSSSGKGNVMTATTAIPPVLPPNDEAEPPSEKKGPGSEVSALVQWSAPHSSVVRFRDSVKFKRV